jgi:2-phospho-L-lactate/phosphoenolpyruvate guanylyltransferase
MRALLLPVKDLQNAKQRLAGFLSPGQRFQLAEAMLADTMRAIRGIRSDVRIFVVTNYQPAAAVARRNGWEVLRETQQTSESVSVDAASRLCADRGISSLLRLPLDLPLVQAADVDAVLGIPVPTPGMLIVPSRDGSGTNALLRTPPALFRSQFGPGSFAKHPEEARRAQAHVTVHRNPRLEMDVDDECDLRVLLDQDLGETETGAWLRANGIAALIAKAAHSAAPTACEASRGKSNTATPR